MFTPPSVSRAEGPIATLTMGAQAAASNWPGGSYDPETHTVFVASQTSIATLGLMPPPPGRSDMAYFQGTVLSGARTTGGSGASAGGAAPRAADAPPVEASGSATLSVQGLPIVKPPYSRITAIDLDKGEIKWRAPFGATPDAIKNNPALKGLNLPPLGRPGNNGGTLVTKTLVVAGESNFGPTTNGQRGAMLRAFDKGTGAEVGALYMPAPQSGSPMTYMLNGTQYLVVAIGGAGHPGELLVFKAGT